MAYEVKSEIRNLATKITEAERQQYQSDLLANLERLDEIDQRFRMEKDRFKGMLTEAEGKSSQTRTILRSGEHYRDIQCDVRFNGVDLTEEVHRTDTGERISVRVLTSGEIARYSQQNLGLDEKDPGELEPVEPAAFETGANDGMIGAADAGETLVDDPDTQGDVPGPHDDDNKPGDTKPAAVVVKPIKATQTKPAAKKPAAKKPAAKKPAAKKPVPKKV